MTGWHGLIGAVILATGISVAAVPPAKPGGVGLYFSERDGLACAGCHGLAGEGGGEGGISIPAIADRVGPGQAYPTQQNFCTLLATGRRPGLPSLSNLMPRYAMTLAECGALYRYVASLSQPVLAVGETRLRVNLEIDARSSGQANWQSIIKDRLARANAAGGIYGRTFSFDSPDPAPLVQLNFSDGGGAVSSDIPTILLQARASLPMTKSIESSSFDEIRAVVASYPAETVMIVDPLGKAPDITKLVAAAEVHKTRVIAASGCANGAHKAVHAIIVSTAATPDLGLGALTSCKELQSVAISLRTVNTRDIAAAARLGLFPPLVSVFTPVPTGAQFAEIPDVLAQIIIDMARRMGGSPSRAERIQAFEQAWRTHARGENALFSGATLADVDPLTMATRSEPAWRDSP